MLAHMVGLFLPFAAKWVGLEGIMPREISQTEKTKSCVILLIYVSKKNTTSEYNIKEADSQIQTTD